MFHVHDCIEPEHKEEFLTELNTMKPGEAIQIYTGDSIIKISCDEFQLNEEPGIYKALQLQHRLL